MLLIFFILLIFAPYEHKYIGKAAFYVGLTGWILINILKHKLRFYRSLIPVNILNKPLLIFGIACLLSILFSLNPFHSQGIFFERYVIYLFYFWFGAQFVTNSKKNLYILIISLICSTFIFSIGGTWDYLYYIILKRDPAKVDRVLTVFGRLIPYFGFSLYLTFFTPFIFQVFIFIKERKLKLIFLTNLILLFLCLIWNASRAAWVSVFLSLVFTSFLNRDKRFLTIRVITFAFLLPLLLFSLLSATVRNRIQTIAYPLEWSNRLPLYNQAISIFRDYPLLGTGIGMYEKIIHTPKYELPDTYPVPKELNLHAHNTYLEIAAEMGIIGFLAFIGIFAVFFIKLYKLIRNLNKGVSTIDKAIFLGLVSTVIAILIFASSSSIITVGVNNSVYFWLIFGMLVGLSRSLFLEQRSRI